MILKINDRIEQITLFFPLQRDSKKAYSPNERLGVERNVCEHLYGDHFTVSLMFLNKNFILVLLIVS